MPVFYNNASVAAMSEESTETPKAEKPAEKLAEVAAYPIAAAAGGYAFKASVDNKLYDNLRSLGWLGDELAKHKQDARNIAGSVGKDASGTLQKFHKGFSEIFGKRLHDLEMDSFLKRLNGLHSAQKVEAAMQGGAVGGAVAVGFGAAFAFASKKKLAEQLIEQNKQTDKNEQTTSL